MSPTEELEIGQNRILVTVSENGVTSYGSQRALAFTMNLQSRGPSLNGKETPETEWKIISVSPKNGLVRVGDTVSIKPL